MAMLDDLLAAASYAWREATNEPLVRVRVNPLGLRRFEVTLAWGDNCEAQNADLRTTREVVAFVAGVARGASAGVKAATLI